MIGRALILAIAATTGWLNAFAAGLTPTMTVGLIGACASPLHAGRLRTSPENPTNLRLVGGAQSIRTLRRLCKGPQATEFGRFEAIPYPASRKTSAVHAHRSEERRVGKE